MIAVNGNTGFVKKNIISEKLYRKYMATLGVIFFSLRMIFEIYGNTGFGRKKRITSEE